MSWLRGMFGFGEGSPGEAKSATGLSYDEMIKRIYHGGPTASGVSVSAINAMQQATVNACVRVRRESLAQLPFVLMERDGEKRQPATKHPLYSLLHDAPNSYLSAYDWKEMISEQVDLRGAHYASITRSGSGKILELLPFNPDRMEVNQTDDYKLKFKFRPPRGGVREFDAEEIFYVRGPTRDGVRGVSVIRDGAETVGLSVAAHKHGAKFFANGTILDTILKHPKTLSEDAQKRLKGQLNDRRGLDQAFEAMVLEEGMELSKLGMSAADAQLIETLKFNRTEICGLFRVPPHKVMDLERSTFSNIEHQSIEFVTDAIVPGACRLEQAADMQLLTDSERGRYYTKLKIQALLRGDVRSRGEFYRVMFNTGAFNPNEIRELEDRDPRPGGEIYLQPTNMVPSGTLPADDPAKTPAKTK